MLTEHSVLFRVLRLVIKRQGRYLGPTSRELSTGYLGVPDQAASGYMLSLLCGSVRYTQYQMSYLTAEYYLHLRYTSSW